MRVTVDAAMRARDVSRPGVEPDPAEGAAAAPAGVPDHGDLASAPPGHGTGDVRDNGTRDSRAKDAIARDEPEGRSRDRRGKAERRRLSKRHVRARR